MPRHNRPPTQISQAKACLRLTTRRPGTRDVSLHAGAREALRERCDESAPVAGAEYLAFSMGPRYHALICTASALETDAVTSLLGNMWGEDSHGTQRYPYAHSTGDLEWKVFVAEVGPEARTAAEAIDAALHHVRPCVVLYVGTAAGFHERGVSTFDLMVPSRIHNYGSGLGYPAPGDGHHDYVPAQALLNLARSVARQRNWTHGEYVGAALGTKISFAPLASGDHELTSLESELYLHIRTAHDDAVAVDLDAGRGYLVASQQHDQAMALVIRGISMLVSDKDHGKQLARAPRAAAISAAFAVDVLMRVDGDLVAAHRRRTRDEVVATRSVSDAVLAWAQRQERKTLTSLPAGAYGRSSDQPLFVSDYQSGDLYIEPPFTVLSGMRPNGVCLTDHVRHRISDRARVVLRAEPGQGKSLFMQLLYVSLLKDVIKDPGNARIPLLLPLDACSALGEIPDMRAHLIERYARAECDMDADVAIEASDDRFVLLLDGLDEMHTVKDPDTLTRVLCAAHVMTSRSGFLELKLGSQVERHGDHLCLDPLTFDEACQTYIRNYCRICGGDPQWVIETIELTPGLREEIRRPLLLFMTVDVIAHPLEDPSAEVQGVWNATSIYKTYIRKWLTREHARSHSIMTPREKQATAERLAWELFQRSSLLSEYGLVDVNDLVVELPTMRSVVAGLVLDGTLVGEHAALLTDLCARCFLLRLGARSQADGAYRFAHKSFFEYLLARYVIEKLSAPMDDLASLQQLLSLPFPDFVIRFIRQSLADGDVPHEASRLEANLMHVLRAADPEYGSPSASAVEMARQQAGNLLPLVATGENLAELLRLAREEPSLLVRRGIAVGVALHDHEPGPLEEFVALMDAADGDADALSAHVGYNRIYYGDQRRTETWTDDGTDKCDGFYTRTLAQLNDRDKYEALWCMTVFTLRWLLCSGRHLGPSDVVRAAAARAVAQCQAAAVESPVLAAQIDLLAVTVEALGDATA